MSRLSASTSESTQSELTSTVTFLNPSLPGLTGGVT